MAGLTGAQGTGLTDGEASPASNPSLVATSLCEAQIGPKGGVFATPIWRLDAAARRNDAAPQSSSGDQAGSDPKFGVWIACSLRPVRSIEKSFGPPEPAASRKNISTRPFGAQVGPSCK